MDGPQRSGRWLRAAVVVLALAGLAVFVVAEWDQVVDAAELLTHADWTWIAIGSVTSIVSIVLFAGVRSVLLGAGGAHLPLGRATTASFASGAIAATLPAGGALATGYMVQRYREAGADGGLAGWTTIATGVVAPAVLVFMTLAGYAVAGEDPSRALLPGAVALVLLGAFFAITRNPWVLRRPAEWCVRAWLALRRLVTARATTSGGDAHEDAGGAAADLADRFVDSFGAVRAGPGRWTAAWVLQVLSWIGEFVALVAAVAAMGGGTPTDLSAWGSILAIYGTSQLAGAIPIIPGGAGQVEAALVVGLTATGTDASTALAASVAFRLMSHWLVVPIGWVCVALLRRKGIDIPRDDADSPVAGGYGPDPVERLEPGG
ncbi:lysylphosphatidylglycerol synthase transmembrane domain-containing protein [Dermatobacter hominis]|uniref:lysylphosphatidylglycerol synthase transmembrane domain-containing protein n=1 Tax=Dermatobacter hominis TaxID=2884263 RepID=UPI001D0FD75A|nr:YbhN family protein [Dermatobacter hominis]UDY34573.1 YbhN family protein [Dermatobacter hominis]